MARSNPQIDSVAEPDLSNRQLGDYLIGRRLGRGGMADVYLATQNSLRRQVALKVLRSNLAKDETFVRRFHHEAQAAASLVHPNIVQIYEVGCIDGIHFIAQEYVDGQNLKQVIRRDKLDVRKAVTIIRQVGAALHKAGQAGIVHRDIKPENILLTTSGEVKVVDFGLARVINDERRVDLTQVGMTLGTPLYMSPEQVEGQPLDPRSDLYSFGVLCYEMFAGRPPFEGETALVVAVQHLKNEPPRLETVREDLPGGLGRIVHKLMAKKPAERYQSAAQMLRDLRAIPVEWMADWHAAEEDWNTAEWEHFATTQLEATQKLATVMLQPTRRASWWRWGSVAVLATAMAFAAGAGAAWLFRPRYLLEDVAGVTSAIPAMATAKEQFDYAMRQFPRSEEAFEAVAKNFPTGSDPQSEIYVRKANLQLAYFYIDINRDADAERLLVDLVAQDADVNLQIQAYVLLANLIFKNPDRKDEARQLVSQLANVMFRDGRTSNAHRDEIARELVGALSVAFKEYWDTAPGFP